MNSKKEYFQNIIDKLPDNKYISRQILDMLNNYTTKIVFDNDIKSSYYVYINDTIYLSNKEKSQKDFSRICLIAHECAHSIQSKLLQKINFILSNIELVFFVIACVLTFINIKPLYILGIYSIIVALSIIPRLILEINAVINSIKISEKYLLSQIDIKTTAEVIKQYNKQIKFLFPIFIVNLILWKIVRVGIIAIIVNFKL